MKATHRLASRLPFYYGWLIIGIAFVTMAISVSARSAFSLLLTPFTEEFGWDRGLVAGAFSFGFFISAFLSPIVGRWMDRYGPRVVIETGIFIMGIGLILAAFIEKPWHLYLTLGVMVGGGANLMSFTAQSLYLPSWFARRRALAIAIAFSGAGVGAILFLPWLQTVIERDGWRTSCWIMGLIVILVLGPINLLVRQKPEDLGLLPDGDTHASDGQSGRGSSNIVDAKWAAIDWTLARALRTARFWWIILAFFSGLFPWYAVQVHQTTYLVGLGYSPILAAWALGIVAVFGIPGQIVLGALSDRIGREWIWSIGCLGFIICNLALILLEHHQSSFVLYVMVISQGFLGYALPSVIGPIVKEIFDGSNYGAIFGAAAVALIIGGAAGPWVTGMIFDATGSYRLAFQLAIIGSIISIGAIWIVAPRKIRLVPGKIPRVE